MSRILIFVNGVLPDIEAAKKIPRRDDFLLGVDGGARLIMELGLTPHLVIGDLDSLTENDLARLNAANVKTIRYPADKNETDLELGIGHARQLNPSSVVILAALGGRTDQALANISLLADSALASLDIRLDDGIEEVFFCRGESQIDGKRGDLVSLIPWRGDVTGVRTAGLEWKLDSETLFIDKTRGVSNEMLQESAVVKIESGLLLIIHRRVSQ
jgi:thiamine pyrophosphokinase